MTRKGISRKTGRLTRWTGFAVRKQLIQSWISADSRVEFMRFENVDAMYGIERWCLWLGDCPPQDLRQLPEARKRVAAVRRFRAASKSAPTQKLANTPTRFHVENMPREPYLLIPKVSSERRQDIPLAFMEPEVLTSDLCFLMSGATLVHFGVLSSAMHMAWVRLVCGRLESRYRYSAKLVYNNFPWPDLPTGKRRAAVEVSAARVLQVRAEYPEATLADLYDPLTMPAKLVKAHAALDRAVDRCYRTQPFATDRQRIEFLFALFAALPCGQAIIGRG